MLVAMLILSSTSSCGFLIQDSVTFHGTQCSDSYVWLGGDIVASAVLVGGAAETPETLLPALTFLASAAIGYYKKNNCEAHQRGASPEEWARDAERTRRENARKMNALSALGSAAIESSGNSGNSKTIRQYKNRVFLKCNDSVLIDETFRTFESCDAFRRKKPLYCQGIKVPIQC